MTLELSHFSAALVFALFASVVFGITQKDNRREMVTYGVRCFFTFVAGVLAAGWFMYLLRR
ncbi:MAG: hypothetical protein M3O85_08730 [Acidobacteriota bacterium]|nr:hypothetical protein [Acidobacteriota bacterium]